MSGIQDTSSGMADPMIPSNDELDTSEPVDEESTGHPLFPRVITETGPDRRWFDWIQVVDISRTYRVTGG